MASLLRAEPTLYDKGPFLGFSTGLYKDNIYFLHRYLKLKGLFNLKVS